MSTLLKFELAPYVLNFEFGADYPARRVTKLFQIQDRAAGGKPQVEGLGITVKTRDLVFNSMPTADYIALQNWHENVVNGAEKSFSFTDEKGDVGEVFITNPEIDFVETSFELYAGSITLEYIQ